jgi:hypothetical protein
MLAAEGDIPLAIDVTGDAFIGGNGVCGGTIRDQGANTPGKLIELLASRTPLATYDVHLLDDPSTGK